MSIAFDTHEVTVLADAMTKASRVAVADTEKVVFVGAIQIKKDAARRISGHRRYKKLPWSIDFDMYRSLKGPSAEIGPNHGKGQGALGNIPEYGTPTSAPIPFMRPAGEAEEPRFIAAMEALAVKALGL